MIEPNIKFRQLDRLIQCCINDEIKQFGLSSGLFNFIVELGDNGELNLSSLSRAVGVDNGHTTRAINKLVKLGYVKKVRDENDARGYKVNLTESGQLVYNEIHRHVKKMLTVASKDIEEKDFKVFRRVVDQLYDGFKAYQEQKINC